MALIRGTITFGVKICLCMFFGGFFFVDSVFADLIHRAIDIGLPYNTPVVAPIGGTVVVSGPSGRCGVGAKITEPDGTSHLICHLTKNSVGLVNGTIQAGEIIGYVGNTGRTFGPHIHWQIRGKNKNFIENKSWILKNIDVVPAVYKNAFYNFENENNFIVPFPGEVVLGTIATHVEIYEKKRFSFIESTTETINRHIKTVEEKKSTPIEWNTNNLNQKNKDGKQESLTQKKNQKGENTEKKQKPEDKPKNKSTGKSTDIYNKENVVFPVGTFQLKIKNLLIGESIPLLFILPAGSVSRTNKFSFVEKDGKLKDIYWIGKETPSSGWGDFEQIIPIQFGQKIYNTDDACFFTAVFTDGGIEDIDGEKNGSITIIGGPGFLKNNK